MPRECATPRASEIACGPQHLSSAREMQSCGHTFMVTPMTSYPCSRSKYAATLESTPPLIPRRTRCLLRLMRMENFDQQVHESTFPGSTGCQAVLFRQPAEIKWSSASCLRMQVS